MEISFLRHGESEANVAGIWQGSRHGGRLTGRGEAQALAAAGRIGRRPFDLVITSGLDRAVATGAALNVKTEIDASWQEIDLGQWDGLTFSEISEIYGDELVAVVTGQPVPMGRTGETLAGLRDRLIDGVERLKGRLNEYERALVVTHGGVIEHLVRLHWGIDAPTPPFAGPANTSITTFRQAFGKLRLATYNDTGHLGTLNEWAMDRLTDGDPVITFVRHGETNANLERRVQGRTDWGLNEHGRRQAELLATWYGKQELVFTSPLGRATETAAAVAADGATELAEFAELSFGSWEGKTFDEVQAAADADLADRIFQRGEDLPRGGDGETWAELSARMTAGVVKAIDHAGGSRRITVVSHGGSIRAYALGNMGVGWPEVLDTIVPPNTAVTHVVMTPNGPILADYAVAAHLE